MSNVENKTTLDKSLNIVTIVGTVKENNLVLGVDKENAEIIKGDLVIQTGQDEEHKVKCYAKKFTSTGKENPSFKSLAYALEYVSVATALTLEGVEATRVSIPKAEIRLNTYLSNRGTVVAYPEIFFSFVQTEKNGADAVAKFEVEGVLESITAEFDKDNAETGRYKMGIVLFDYNGRALPLEFLATPEAGSYMSTNYETNRTSRVWGNIISTVTHVEKVTSGITGDKVEVFDNVKQEMLIDNGVPEQKTEEAGYNIELVKKAMAERDILVEEIKNKGQKAPVNAGFTAPSATSPSKPAPAKW